LANLVLDAGFPFYEEPMNNQPEIFQPSAGGLVKAWTRGVLFEEEARRQVENMASLPFIHKWVAIMPDVHAGKGATVGSVIPTVDVIIPAAVGVDIGCGMMAVRTSLRAEDLPDDLGSVRTAIEKAVPHGRTDNGGRNDRGAWHNPPQAVLDAWSGLQAEFQEIKAKTPKIGDSNSLSQLGTLGTGNHFLEVCLDLTGSVWIMLHSGSRGVGNKIGTIFIEKAKREMERWHIRLPDADLAYLPVGSQFFGDYLKGVNWAQKYAMTNRELMMQAALGALASVPGVPPFQSDLEAINCHHNYVSREHHFGKDIWVTRKGAVRVREGEMGIIPGSMGAKSFLVRGKGHAESFHSCSHGAGRAMSRTEARRRFTLEDHLKDTEGIECRKDSEVIDETPRAYKDIDSVMAAQKDLVEVVHTLRQVLCVKG
jgi:tRNA-splicing ligase RtcB